MTDQQIALLEDAEIIRLIERLVEELEIRLMQHAG